MSRKTTVIQVEIRDLAPLCGAAAPSTLSEAALLTGGGPLIVHLDGSIDTDLVEQAVTNLKRAPSVTVIVGNPKEIPESLASAADVCLTSAANPPAPFVTGTTEVLSDAVAAQPQATLALVVLLRATATLRAIDAIAMESSTYGMLLASRGFSEWLDRRGPMSSRPTCEPPITIERAGGSLRIGLNRPEVRNALNAPMRDALVEALDLARVDPEVSEIILHGHGESFCAGGDLAEFGTVGDGALSFAIRMTCHPGSSINAVSRRTTALLHGHCIGAGIEIPAFANRVVADPGATMRLPEVSMGLIPGAGGTFSIARRIGRQRTNWLALTGAPLNASTGLDWGLVDEIRPRVSQSPFSPLGWAV